MNSVSPGPDLGKYYVCFRNLEIDLIFPQLPRPSWDNILGIMFPARQNIAINILKLSARPDAKVMSAITSAACNEINYPKKKVKNLSQLVGRNTLIFLK